MSKTIVQIENIFKIYKSGNVDHSLETVALQGISLDIKQDDFIIIMGPSGSGKTTLLNIIGGLDQPSAGNVIFNTERRNGPINLATLAADQLDDFRFDKIGVVFQDDNMLYHLTALENVELPLKFLGIRDSRKKATKILTKLGLGERLHHHASQLSAGERQRVALSSALAFKPLIILADEPTGELDSENVTQVMELFKQIQKEEDVIFLIVTHNPMVASFGNRFFSLYDGKLAEQSNPSSFDQFSAKLGEYIIPIDRFSRISIPQDLIIELDQEEDLLQIVFGNNTIRITVPDEDDEVDGEKFFVQLDNQNRILLPDEIKKSIDNSGKFINLRASFDDSSSSILITLSEENKQ